MSEQENPSLLAAGAALGSLTPQERADYETYLAASADGRSEANAFDATAKALESDVAEEAPPVELKARLMAQVATTAQLPRPEPAVSSTPTAAPQAGPAEHRAQARWFRRPSMVLAAAAAAAVLLVGGGTIGLAIGNGSSVVQEQATTFAQISAAPDVQRASQKTADGTAATLIWSKQLGKSAVVLNGLEPPPAGKTYQLWYINGKKATSAGLMSPSSKENAWQVLEGRLTGGAVIGMTVEPDGGSKAPTTKPILAIPS